MLNDIINDELCIMLDPISLDEVVVGKPCRTRVEVEGTTPVQCPAWCAIALSARLALVTRVSYIGQTTARAARKMNAAGWRQTASGKQGSEQWRQRVLESA